MKDFLWSIFTLIMAIAIMIYVYKICNWGCGGQERSTAIFLKYLALGSLITTGILWLKVLLRLLWPKNDEIKKS